MLGINIGGEFLDLSPATSTKLERTSPFFNLQDLAGEYSVPLSIPYTPKNARLLGLPNHYYTRRIKKKISARLFDNNNFSYAGELVIEAAELDVNEIGNSKINGYFLTGVSSFFQLVNTKKLKELQLGGVRSFAWTNNDPDSPHIGFWQHIHKTFAGTMPYSFAPVRNEKWSGGTDEGTADWMNKLDNVGKLDYENNFNTLAPQVSLKYLLEQIFEEHGWELDATGMNDDQWKMMYIPSFYAVTWQKIIQTAGEPYFAYAPLNNMQINLQNHVPPEMRIPELILAIRNQYNWGFDFDSVKKVCSMAPLKELANGIRKDWSAYMPPRLVSDFSEEEKVFSFKCEIDSADGLSSSPDFSKAEYGEPVETFTDLPAPGEDNFNLVIYVWKDNRFYQCRYNEEDAVYHWDIFADNIYDVVPEGSNQDITTKASTMPVYKTLYRTNGITDYYGLFPLCEQEGNWEGKKGEFIPWGLRILFNRGLVWEANPLGNKGQLQYPHLTSICFTITQEEPDLDWSNVWQHNYQGIDKGIITKWFKETLKYLATSDVTKGTLNLPRKELVNFRWSDVILLRNIPFVMQKISEVIPYQSTVEVEMRRIG